MPPGQSANSFHGSRITTHIPPPQILGISDRGVRVAAIVEQSRKSVKRAAGYWQGAEFFRPQPIGLPACYVSGYLDSPRAIESGNAASHAWVDVFRWGTGWISLDPTHNCQQNASYARVAVGRDYADVPPTRGIYKGNSEENMEVTVRVEAI